MNLEKLLYVVKQCEILDSRSSTPINQFISDADVSLMQNCIASEYTTIRNVKAHKLLTHLSLSNSEHYNILFQIGVFLIKPKQQMIESNQS